jgi:hypothetical protein
LGLLGRRRGAEALVTAMGDGPFRLLGRSLPWTRAVAALLALFLAINYHLVTGRAAPIFDAEWYYAPYYMLVADHARAGRLLLWNPWTNGGSPDFADPQSGAFSPIGVLLGGFTGGTSAGFLFYWLLVWFVAGLGVLALGRHLKAPPWGAFVAALGFLFSGFFLGHAEHVTFVYTLAWLPYVILRLDVALLERRVRPAFEAGAIWGLSGLAGYPGLVFATGTYAGLWAVGRWFCVESPSESPPAGSNLARTIAAAKPPFHTVLRALLIVLVTGVVVMSPTYAALIIESRGFSDRADPLPRETAIRSNALNPGSLATVFSPWLGTLPPARGWRYTDLSSSSIYVGAAVAWLSLCALLLRPRDSWRWWLWGLALLGLGLSLGPNLPLRGWLYDFAPPTRYFRHTAMFRAYTIFSMVILALIATRDLSSNPRNDSEKRRWRFLLLAAMMIVIGTVSLYAVARTVGHFPKPGHPLHFWIVWLGVLVAAAVGGLLRTRRRTALFSGTLVCIAVVDAVGAFHVAATVTVERQDLAGIEQWRRIDAEHEGNLELTARGTWRAMVAPEASGAIFTSTNLPRKVAVLGGYSGLTNRVHFRWAKHPILRAAATGEDRFWFGNQVAWVVPSDAVFEAFVRRTEALGAPPLVLHLPDVLGHVPRAGETTSSDLAGVDAINALPAASRIPIALEAYWPDELVFGVNCTTAGWLLVTDRWTQGWRVTVDGKEAVNAGGDFIFRAVPVKAGLNQVRFTYHPFGFPWLLIVSWGTLAAIGGWAARVTWRNLRTQSR